MKSGGGIFNDFDTNSTSVVTLTNCIVWGNDSMNAPNPWRRSIYNDDTLAGAAAVKIDHSLVQGAGSPVWAASADLTDNGGNYDMDPMFHTDIVNPGSSTPTDGGDFRIPFFGSPAHGRGTATDAPGKDIAGLSRGTPPDMGAYEAPEGPPLGLEALWLFNQNTSDQTGNIADGTLNAVTWSADRFNEMSSAGAYDGTSSYWLSGLTGEDVFSGDFTLNFWIYPTDLSVDWQPLLSKDGDAGQDHPCTSVVGVAIDAENNLRAFMGEGTGSWGWPSCESTTALTVNTWYMVTMTLSGSTLRLYVNGAQEGTDQTITTRLNSSEGLRVGHSPDVETGGTFSEYYSGRLDDLRVDSRAWTAAQVAEFYGGQ